MGEKTTCLVSVFCFCLTAESGASVPPQDSRTTSPDLFESQSLTSASSKPSSARKTPESFLGPNAALVNLDSLVTKPAPPAQSLNPFLAPGRHVLGYICCCTIYSWLPALSPLSRMADLCLGRGRAPGTPHCYWSLGLPGGVGIDAEVREETTSWRGTCHRSYLHCPFREDLISTRFGSSEGCWLSCVSHVIGEILP